MVEVELTCKGLKYSFVHHTMCDVFESYRMPDMSLVSAIDFIDNKLLGIGRDIINGHSKTENNEYATIKSSLKADKVVNLNCDDQSCKTINLRTMKPIPPNHTSGYIGTATHGKLKIAIECPTPIKCKGLCYAMLESGKCSDKLVVETIGKTFFANKYGKQK